MDARMPHRLESERLALRAFDLTDTPVLHAAVLRNREHLRPWMPWASTEWTLDGYLEWVASRRAAFDLGEDYGFGIFERGSGELVGSSGLHTRCGPGGLEVGYWIDKDRCGLGLATEAAAVLTRAAFDHMAMPRVELRVQEENRASCKVAEKLGFTFEGVLRSRLEHGGRWVDLASYCMIRAEVAESPAARFSYRAFDALGRSLEVD